MQFTGVPLHLGRAQENERTGFIHHPSVHGPHDQIDGFTVALGGLLNSIIVARAELAE